MPFRDLKERARKFEISQQSELENSAALRGFVVVAAAVDLVRRKSSGKWKNSDLAFFPKTTHEAKTRKSRPAAARARLGRLPAYLLGWHGSSPIRQSDSAEENCTFYDPNAGRRSEGGAAVNRYIAISRFLPTPRKSLYFETSL